jgi:hypothetical protein
MNNFQWISIADQLPPQEQTVLVSLESGEVVIAFLGAASWYYVSNWMSLRKLQLRVTDWASIPAPPNRRCCCDCHRQEKRK